jgi:hypothetical protein
MFTEPADMYAVSILTFYLLTHGQHPFWDPKKVIFDVNGQIESNWDLLDSHEDLTE